MAEREAAAGLYSLLNANAEDGRTTDPQTAAAVAAAQAQNGEMSFVEAVTPTANPNDSFVEVEQSPESIRKLTEMLLQKRPVVDPLKNQGYGIVTPHQHDILSGRGNGANQHPGNIFFRNLIHKYKHHYIHTGPSEKKLITKRIVEEVQQRNPPGRFLKQNQDTELWDCLDIEKVLKKTGQALREKAPELKKRAREEYKLRVNSSHESYFQNTNIGIPIKQDDRNIIRFDNEIPLNSMKHAMSFPMQTNTLDQIAYQNIPLASPLKAVNDSFNMAHLTAITNQVDPENKKKAEELISKAVDPNVALSDVFNYVKENTKSLFINKTKIVQTQVPMQIARAAQISQGRVDTAFSAATPHAHDVLFRNGVIVPSHPGSKFFCDQVNLLLPQYQGSLVNEKRIEQKVIASIGARWPPGRFLSASNHTCTSWHVLTFAQALQATSNHLRHAYFESQRVVVPNLHDVLLIKANQQHQGNIYFKSLVEKLCPKREEDISQHLKKNIAKQILDEIDRVGGRFLKYNQHQNKWERLDFEISMIKTIQALGDYQKKKELQQKSAKTVEVVVPTLTCVKESVQQCGKDNSDPPGVFYNYYLNGHNNDNDTLAIDIQGNDPPGQVANVVPTQKVNGIPSDGLGQDHTSPQLQTIQNHTATKMGVLNGTIPSPQLGHFSGMTPILPEQSPDPPSSETRKRVHEMDEFNDIRMVEKKQKLEP